MPGQDARELLHTYEMVTEHFAIPNLNVVVAKYWFLGHVGDRTFMCSVFTATLTYMIIIIIIKKGRQCKAERE